MAPTPSGGGLNSRVKYDWDAHKESIVRLYQEKGFKVMKKEMTKKGFSPTRRSYFNKFNEWGIEKNIKTQDMKFIVHKRRKMRGLGKMTVFKLHGKVVPERKLDRFEQREPCNGSDDEEHQNRGD
ncbi:hypothetical protein GTA08_BOTSDO02722 [Botryosphaeria dothidea]|uniref:Clr5 domain-containing protein n=1 Tax=Botryosphaeria dothidea TaxID=55169 RepID=A0A8H4NCG7_9PEZI|nr:hypothetical protein GTA08_BOTSDO02722 [Botryosphaeria dothidea]